MVKTKCILLVLFYGKDITGKQREITNNKYKEAFKIQTPTSYQLLRMLTSTANTYKSPVFT